MSFVIRGRSQDVFECSPRTCVMLVIPSTKQIASKIFDFPEPFNPVIALNDGSHPVRSRGIHWKSATEADYTYSALFTCDCRPYWVRLEAFDGKNGEIIGQVIHPVGYRSRPSVPSRMSSSILMIAEPERVLRCNSPNSFFLSDQCVSFSFVSGYGCADRSINEETPA